MARQRRPGPRVGTPEHAERSARGTLRALEVERRADAATSVDVTRWLRVGAVSEQLRPIVRARLHQREQMVEDLGGAEHVSIMQRATLDTWLMAQVAADAEWRRYICEGDREALERLSTLLNTARAGLLAVGLTRIARDVTPTLDSYLAQRPQVSQEPVSATIDASAVSEDVVRDEGSADAEQPRESDEGESADVAERVTVEVDP